MQRLWQRNQLGALEQEEQKKVDSQYCSSNKRSEYLNIEIPAVTTATTQLSELKTDSIMGLISSLNKILNSSLKK